MAQPKKSGINWKLYGGILAVGAVVYFMTGGSPPPVASKPAAKKKPPAAPGQTQLLPADYNATPTTFQPVMFSIKDTFVPLVYRTQAGSPDSIIRIQSSELTIPGNFTGGETNWAFNGATQVDGKWSALVENGTSGQDAYLHAGEKWKSSTVKDITESVLILRDVSGAEKTIKMQADIQAEMAKQQADLAELKTNASSVTRTVNSPNAPLDPGLVGTIGTDTTVQADGSSGQTYQQMGGGRGRGGGGRGGGGGNAGGGRGGRGGGRGGGYGGGGG